MRYTFKQAEELGWALVVAALVYAAQLAVAFDPDTVTDWKTYAIAVAGGLVRTIGGAFLASMRPGP